MTDERGRQTSALAQRTAAARALLATSTCTHRVHAPLKQLQPLIRRHTRQPLSSLHIFANTHTRAHVQVETMLYSKIDQLERGVEDGTQNETADYTRGG